jgi:L-ascorbate metabolism protein UlaG (beta-lactamase superfamily)
MIINWYGEGCFKIQTGGLTIMSDPFSSSSDDIGSGLTAPRFKSDITLVTRSSFPIPYKGIEGDGVVTGPGEYEIQGIEITGTPLASDEKYIETAYSIRAEDMRIGFLGHVSHMPEPSLLEAMGEIDILFIPAGGKPFIEQELAAKLVKQLHPKIVIPSFFKIAGLKRASADAKAFLEELGQEAAPVEKLAIKKKELPQKTQIVVLTL